ncbi:MAG TPA: glutamyl-tRNA reductase [Streptosporangiaceae bacterium]|nr:glutamyl-tRNA reductase [Streptosporangiaceae bacterium]
MTDAANAMTIVSLGLSHRVTPPEILEKLAVPSAQRGGLLARLRAVPSIDEVVVLSTCNRVEVYASAQGPAGQVTQPVADLLAAQGQVPASKVMGLADIRTGGAAAEHLFSVASGLDSMAIGEEQIVAQVKDAARAATAAGTTGSAINGLIDAALHASKRARTQTTISSAGISLAAAGLDLAGAHLAGLAGRDAVVLGTGSMGKLAARLLHEAGVGRLRVVGRDFAAAAELAAEVGGRPLPASDLPAALADADVLVTAAASTTPVVPAQQVQEARVHSRGRPLFVLDLGMPPNVEAAVGRLARVSLAGIRTVGEYLADRDTPDQVPEARAIVAEEVAAYTQRQQQASAAPVIAAMHAQIRQIADAELERLRDRLPDLTEKQQAETAATVHRILRKVLHRPTVRAKQFATGPEGSAYLEALRQLFDLTADEDGTERMAEGGPERAAEGRA